MQINKKIVDGLIKEFSLLKEKNCIDKKNLSKFDLQKKEDLLYFSFIDNKNQHYVTFLHFLIRKLNPDNVVELGNREGVSTLAMYDAIKKTGSSFYSIDIEKDQRYCPEHMFHDKQMRFLFGDVCSLDIIKKLPKNIDILFTDTIHFDFQVRDEWEIYQHLLSDLALVAIDDINIHDKRKLFDEVQFSKWDLTELCHASGWGLFLFERKIPIEESVQSQRILEAIIRVWERKYSSLYQKMLEDKGNGFFGKIKYYAKKIKILYYVYTLIFNTLYYLRNKNKKVSYSNNVRY